MLKAYRFRLYPNEEQRIYLAKTFGCARFVYNKMLADRIKFYEENKDLDIKTMKYPTPAQYKNEYQWLKEVDSLALANAQINLDKAYKNFFRDKRAKRDKFVGFPKFKKKSNTNSYTTNNQNVKLPKTDKKVGAYLGIREFAITSDGEFFRNPQNLKKSEKRLKKIQRDLSRKEKGSNNRRKARIKVAKIHEKISNQRKDMLHKVSTQLISKNQVIVIEDLKVSNLIKNHKLAKSIADVSWSEFISMLTYKAKWYGREIIIAPSNYSSSQLCSNCGNKSSQTKDLSCRTYICPVCGMTLIAWVNLFRLEY